MNMSTSSWILYIILVVSVFFTLHALYTEATAVEPFVNLGGSVAGLSLTDMSTQALDSAPTTSEVKGHYKTLLLFADADIRKQGQQGLRILADFRDRLFGPSRDFRPDLTVEDFLGNWPSWMPPLDTTIKEPVPAVEDAVTAEARMLAYLQKNYPQESLVDEQTGSTVRNLIEDFGRRFVFTTTETVQLRPDFMDTPLLTNWKNPAFAPPPPPQSSSS